MIKKRIIIYCLLMLFVVGLGLFGLYYYDEDKVESREKLKTYIDRMKKEEKNVLKLEVCGVKGVQGAQGEMKRGN